MWGYSFNRGKTYGKICPVSSENLYLYRVLLIQYLKLWPVHVHARTLDVSEQLQILLWAGWCDDVFKFSVYRSISVDRQEEFTACVMIGWSLPHHVNSFKHAKPLVLCEVDVVFDTQQHIPEEAQPLLFKLLALLKHLLHVFHVLRSALA